LLKRSGIAAALLLLLAGAAALALLAGQRLGRSGETAPLAAADHALLLETARLDEAWPGAALEPGRAERRKTVFDGDKILLEYRYRGAGEAQGLFVRQAVYLEPSPLWARLTAWWLWGQTERELEQGGGGDFTLSRRDELFAWGDASRFGYVELGGRARGSLLIARQGRAVLYLLAIGFTMEHHYNLVTLVAPVLAALERRAGGARAGQPEGGH